MTADEIRSWLVAEIARKAGVDPSMIDVREPFDAYGLSSTDALALSGQLEQLLARTLSPTLVYEYPNIAALSEHLGSSPASAEPFASGCAPASGSAAPIAIIGMACRFPRASDPAALWRLLRDGVDAIREVPLDRWDAAAFYDPDVGAPGKANTRWGGFLDRVDQFDPFFFGISPGEAERMDPQQRLLLELAYEAFEDAGYVGPRLAGSRTGILVGISVNEYGLLQLGHYELLNGHSGTGAALSIAANRISYFFDLHGPSIAVDTACSSSLVAVHLACRSLRAGECDLALAGGVNLILSPAHSIAFTKAGILAPDGRCKPFDAAANGYVRSEGGGLVVLKPLDQAIAQGDLIYAVIRGSAVLQDGRTNGLIAPNRLAQEAVLRAAYRDAGVSPGGVRYVEAHGTGTLLGDAMEAQALEAVLASGRAGEICALGSIKSNLGHLEAAAGIAGLIKTVLSLRHGAIPPSLHFHTPNPHVSFGTLGLRVQEQLGPWPDHCGPALAGVSSFGFGGTNVHVVVEEAPESAVSAAVRGSKEESRRAELLPLSARSAEALSAVAGRFRELVADHQADPAVSLGDLCFSAGTRRNHWDHRLAVIARSEKELAERLDCVLRGEDHPDIMTGIAAQAAPRKLVFVFSGQGSQWPGMGRELWRQEPVFRAALERCDEALRPCLGWSLLDRLLGGGSEERGLVEIDAVQPALFAIQAALAALWRSWGIEPDAVTGHSMGEVAAAHVAGVLSLEDAGRVICARSRLLKGLSGLGGMVVVGLSGEETASRLGPQGNDLFIAASNGPRSTVVAGEDEALSELVAALERDGTFCRRVNVDVAAHGPRIAPLADELQRLLAGITPKRGSIPFVSSVFGATGECPVLGPSYWAKNLTEPVNFSGSVRELLQSDGHDFLEISPHPILQSSVQQWILHLGREGMALSSMHREEAERSAMLRSLAALYLSGRAIDWRQLHPSGGKIVSLPTYPWQRQRLWLEGIGEGTPPPAHRADSHSVGDHPLLGRRIALAREARTWLWQNDSGIRSQRFLRDHMVGAEVVVPGSLFVEMALSAAAQAGIAETHVLEDVVFSRALELRPDARETIQAVLGPADPAGSPATLSFGIYSKAGGSGLEEWTLHATASFVPLGPLADGDVEDRPALDSPRSRCTMEVRPDELYRELAEHGLNYGPAMRAIDAAWRGNGEALGHVSLPETSDGEAARYRIHPVLLDASLHILGAVAPVPVAFADEFFVPVQCRRIRLVGQAGSGLWSHVVVRSHAAAGAGEIEADVHLLDDAGRRIGELIGLRLARVRRAHRPVPKPDQDTWLYRVRWMSSSWPAPETGEGRPHEVGNRWIILADGHGLAEALQRELEARGHSCRLIRPDPVGSVPQRGLEGGWSRQDLALQEVIREGLASELSPVRGVVHLWGTDARSFSTAQTLGLNAVIDLVRRLVIASGSIGNPRLWLVTRGAQAVLERERVSVEQAPLWGLGKSIALELPQLRCALVDLDPALDPLSVAESLCRELLSSDAEDQIALRGGSRLVARLLPHELPDLSISCASNTRNVIRPDGTYLITGGLGGLGLTVARWMADRGARHLVLVGRNPPSQAAARAIDTMRQAGAEVVVVSTDVAEAAEVQSVAERIRRTMPRLAGVVHAAGVLENGPVVDLDADRLSRVMAPKVAGAWNLHEVTRGEDLDFFLQFSSAVAVLGSPGQGGYAAANSFLDALAHYRRAEGLPAVSINWGPWADVGLVAQGNFIGAQDRTGHPGVKGIAPQRGLEVLAALLGGDIPQVTVLPFDLQTLLDLYPSAARIPLFAEVGGRDSHVSRFYARPTLRQEYVAPRNDLERRLAELWRQTLRIDRVGVRDSFFELGGDSVLAVQIVTSAQRAFGVELDLREAFQSFTIERLAQRVEATLIARLDALSESEVEQLLQDEKTHSGSEE